MTKRCVHCGKTYETARSTQRYCNHRCKYEIAKLRKRTTPVPYYIDNAPIREAVLTAIETGETNWGRLAEHLGYRKAHTQGLWRALGVRRYIEPTTKESVLALAMQRGTATWIMDRMGGDPSVLKPAPRGWANGDDLVLNEPVRELVLRRRAEGCKPSLADLAREQGRLTGDPSRLKTMLGVKVENRTGLLATQIEYDKAVEIIRTIGLDPSDLDL